MLKVKTLLVKRNALGMTGLGRAGQSDLETCRGASVGHDKKIASLKKSLKNKQRQKKGGMKRHRDMILQSSRLIPSTKHFTVVQTPHVFMSRLALFSIVVCSK